MATKCPVCGTACQAYWNINGTGECRFDPIDENWDISQERDLFRDLLRTLVDEVRGKRWAGGAVKLALDEADNVLLAEARGELASGMLKRRL